MIGQYDWVDFYEAFAERLLDFKTNRPELISIIRDAYNQVEIALPTLDKDNNITDIDPFTTFGLFNKNSIKHENRIKIIGALADRLDIKTAQPTSFDGIPVVLNQNATFYQFGEDRAEGDIDALWNLFETALIYSKEPSPEHRSDVSTWFDKAINLKGNANSKITMALYWIAPHAFLNLDSKNEWYIYKSGNIPDDIVKTIPPIVPRIPAEKYFDIVEKIRDYIENSDNDVKDFKDLSYTAWRCLDEMEKEKKLNNQKTTALADDGVDTVHYWLYSPGHNADKWDEFYKAGIMGIGWDEIGDLTAYPTKESMKAAMKENIDSSKAFTMAAHATWQFAKEMKIGDIIFVKKGMYQLVGKGVVTSDYYFDDTRNDGYSNLRKVMWTDKGSWPHPGQAVMKTLTDLTSYTEYVEKLCALFEDSERENDEGTDEKVYPEYTADDFLNEVYMSSDDYQTLVGLIEKKKNVILQGAPGVGKTFSARRLAYSMVGERNPNRVALIQFHQSYSYEDFIEGFRPSQGGGFEIKKGSFYKFCKRAEEDDPDNKYFFIIDEINRGNLSKIFGELFMLIEQDKRNSKLNLLYSDEKFSVPENVYIIGMMNTADRSLAMLDYALRRRFAFFDIKPGFQTDGFRIYRDSLNNEKFNKLIAAIERLNAAIAEDVSLGEGFCIGHSYFCGLETVDDKALRDIVEYEIIPLIKEYWFDEPQKVKEWSDILWSAIR